MTHIKTCHREEVRDLMKQGKLSGVLTPSLETKEIAKANAVSDIDPPADSASTTASTSDGENILGITPEIEAFREEPRQPEQDEMTPIDVRETTIYLCSFCNCTFENFAECENHMRTVSTHGDEAHAVLSCVTAREPFSLEGSWFIRRLISRNIHRTTMSARQI